MKFGDRLKELRLLNNLTQKELGDKLNISDRVIGYYESNEEQVCVFTSLHVLSHQCVTSKTTVFKRTFSSFIY